MTTFLVVAPCVIAVVAAVWLIARALRRASQRIDAILRDELSPHPEDHETEAGQIPVRR